MSSNFYINDKDRKYLRRLAKKQLAYANLPTMEARKERWYRHNSLSADKPMIVIEMETFKEDLLPGLKCNSEITREIERYLLKWITNHELIDDDKVIPSYFPVYWNINIEEFGLEIDVEKAEDSKGRKIGYRQKHPITDLKKDFHKLKKSKYSVDKKQTLALRNFVEEIFGDILPVKIKNNSLNWYLTPSRKVVDLMGLETMMYTMVDYPEKLHDLFRYLVKDIKDFIGWQQKNGLLVLNNNNDYVGSGSYGFNRELPTAKDRKHVISEDLWGNLNSQETVGVSPEMYGEFIYPYYRELAREFGLVYYGCCEPVHNIWDNFIRKLPNLRKVSVSPWCDEEIMGEFLENSNVIYSRKPSPNFLGEGTFDEKEFSKHIMKTLEAASGCSLEIIYRDVYTLNGDKSKPGKAVELIRKMINEVW